jgi:succinate dehydrogenase hydrophobic anchor subunit
MPLVFPLRKELGGILIIILIFFIFPYMVRKIDGTAAAIDPGIISAIILTVLAVLVFKTVTWWLLKTIWPVLTDYSDNHFERNFKSLITWQKIVTYLSFYLMILYAFVVIFSSII